MYGSCTAYATLDETTLSHPGKVKSPCLVGSHIAMLSESAG